MQLFNEIIDSIISMDLAALRNLVQEDLAATDNVIDSCLQSDIKLIQEVGRHLIYSGGKRLRPLVVLLSAHAFNYQGQAHVNLAGIIELIHTATLLHDDVVDTSELRRNQKTANSIWGNSASVLVGDFIYSRTFQMMVKLNNMRVMDILAEATNKIAAGEILQLLNRHDPSTNEARYMDVIRAKTGILFATAAQLGPIIAGCSEQEITTMANYGMHLGIAFQLVDDALDYNTKSETLGKNQGDDLADGNPTLPLIYAMKHADETQERCIHQAIKQGKRDQLDVILAAIEATGAIAYTYQLAQYYAQQAINCLEKIPSSAYRTALIELANFAVERTY